MSKRNRLVLILVVAVISIALFAGCGDPNREDCKKACEKMVQCDDIAEGGSGALDDQWLTNCKNACDEADEIESTIADCMLNTECADIASTCGTGTL